MRVVELRFFKIKEIALGCVSEGKKEGCKEVYHEMENGFPDIREVS